MTEVADRKKSGSRRERTVHFDLEGAWLADFARTRVEEGAWDSALKLLTENLEGMTHEQAQKILTGRATLTGWASDKDGLGYEELPDTHELAVQMDEVHDRLYGNVFRWKGEYWEPYAIVRGWNRDDMMFASSWEHSCQALGFDGKDSRLSALRSLYYADDRLRDLVVYVDFPLPNYGTNVLCRKAQMPPLWFKTPLAGPEEVLAGQLAKGSSWELRGADGGSSRVDDYDDLDDQRTRVAPAAAPEPEATVEDANAMAKEFLRRLNATESSADINALNREFGDRFDEMRRTARVKEVGQTLADAEDAAYGRLLETYRGLIVAQAETMGGWLELKVKQEDGTPFPDKPEVLRVPKNAFILWALRSYDFERHGKERPEWKNVCPMGMKMTCDDRNHTDWLVGAGMRPEDAYADDKTGTYEKAVYDASWRLRSKLTYAWAKAQFVTLARGPEDRFWGEVVQPAPGEGVEPGSIAVVPTAGPEFQLAMETACKRGKHGRPGLLICDTGGKLAHLAVVGREMKCTVLMLPNATKRFATGTSLSVDLNEGTLHWTP